MIMFQNVSVVQDQFTETLVKVSEKCIKKNWIGIQNFILFYTHSVTTKIVVILIITHR